MGIQYWKKFSMNSPAFIILSISEFSVPNLEARSVFQNVLKTIHV